MNFFEQITLWEAYCTSPIPDPPPDVRFTTASESLQKRSRETIELLERFAETKN